MDDLEFRRRILANPHDTDPDVLKAIDSSKANQSLAEELEQLDSLIDQTLRVDVPDDLADRILFQQTSKAEREKKKPRFQLAIAASIALVFGILLGQFNWSSLPVNQNVDLNTIALEHYYHENGFISNINEAASVQQVNAKLAPLGQAFNGELPGTVAYINHCGFGGEHALHMVLVDENQQRYTVFLVPQESASPTQYSDGSMTSLTMPLQNASVIVVGENEVEVSPIAEKLKQSLTQQQYSI